MITKITVTLQYEQYEIDLCKTYDLPAFPPSNLIIVDWTNDNEVTVHASVDEPMELLYIVSENTLYLSNNKYFEKEEQIFRDLCGFLNAHWEIQEPSVFDSFIKEYPNYVKFWKKWSVC